MPQTPVTEFRKHLQPIRRYVHNGPTDDLRLYVPFNETVFSRPLRISAPQNRCCDILMAKSAGLVNRHYHPREVLAYTISGKWGYLQHDWTAALGDFIHEGPGEGHTSAGHVDTLFR